MIRRSYRLESPGCSCDQWTPHGWAVFLGRWSRCFRWADALRWSAVARMRWLILAVDWAICYCWLYSCLNVVGVPPWPAISNWKYAVYSFCLVDWSPRALQYPLVFFVDCEYQLVQSVCTDVDVIDVARRIVFSFYLTSWLDRWFWAFFYRSHSWGGGD